MKLKVLFVITRLASGGAPQIMMDMLQALKTTGYDVKIITGISGKNEQDLLEEIKKREIEVIVIPQLVRQLNPIHDLVAFFKLYHHIKKYQADIVHTHTSKAGFLGRLAARLAGTKIIFHSTHGHVFQGYFGPVLTKIFVALERMAALWSTRIMTLTRREIEEHLELRIGQRSQFRHLYNGIPIESYQQHSDKKTVLTELGLSDNALIITSVGRLVPVKGHKYLIEAIKKIISSPQYNNLPRLRCLIVGDGELREDLKRQINESGLDQHVTLLGQRQDIPRILSISNVFVFPSLNEGFGLAAVEAMAAGLPVIASRVGGIPEIVTDGETGVLVPPADSHALANAIAAVLKDQELQLRMGQAARKRAVEQFSVEKMNKELLALYDEVLTQAC